MKKLLALALTAMMLVCAIVPAFAAVEASDSVPADLENAERVNFREQVEPLFTDGTYTWGNTSGFPWNPGDFTAGGQYPKLEANAFWFISTDFVLEADFTPAEDGEYAFAMYIANKTTKGDGKTPLDSTKSGKFSVQIMNGSSEVAYYEIEEEEAVLGSRIYYRLGDGVALEADTDYTVCVKLLEATDSCIVDFLFGIPGEASDDPAEDTTAAEEDTTAPEETTDAPTTSGEASVAEALPELFEDADVINLNAIYEEVNVDGEYPAGKVLYGFHKGDFNKMGIPDMQGVMPFANCEYPVEFEVGDDGKYAFNISLANYGTAGAVTVKFYDEDGNKLAEETVMPTDMEVGKMYYYTLATELDLAADSWYTATFSGAKESGASGNSIVCEFAYALTELADDAGSSSEDTAPSGNDEPTSPATFDVALIALAVAGASAAAAVVSKKRR